MRASALSLMLLASLALVLPPAKAEAAGIPINPAGVITFTDCAAAGSSAQTVPAGDYVLTVTGSDVTLCWAASSSTCGSGGITYPLGTVILITAPRGLLSLSCRSSASTGDAQLTPAG